VAAVGFTHTWGLGGMALVLVLLLFFSGILLRFAYDPFPGRAYDSIVVLQRDWLFGRWVRAIHYWSANFLVLVVFLHLLRVVLTGGFRPPRHINWFLGLLLWVNCMAIAFTGYLLPWDQLAYWAITICTGMVSYLPVVGSSLQQIVQGGDDIGLATLRLFFTFHTAVLPGSLLTLLAFHFWYIRRAGGVVVSDGLVGDGAASTGWVDREALLWRELTVALVLVAAVSVVSALFDAPLGDKADPTISLDPVKAPWYFAGLQEMLLLLHPFLAIFGVPVMIGILLLRLPFISVENRTGRWFYSRKGRQSAAVSAGAVLVIAPVVILGLDRLYRRTDVFSRFPAALLPLLMVMVALIGYGWFLRKRLAADRYEVFQSVLVVLVVVFAVLTLSGVFFRGEGMALRWPL
jgi:quinol-cytochrome oxidoreductase complex cytochrome b subunit